MSSGDERFDSTDRGESSRGKNNYNQFNPNLGPEFYKAENLEKFILTAGAQAYDTFKNEQAQEKKRLMDKYVTDSGANPHQYDNTNVQTLQGNALTAYNDWKRQIAALHQGIARTGEYRKVLHTHRYNTVMRLHQNGQLKSLNSVSQAEAANVGLAREITKADVINKIQTMGRETFLQWLNTQSPEGFKANALEEAARQLQVRGFSTISGTGNPRKVNLYNLIMQQTGGRARGNTRSGEESGTSQGSAQINNNLSQELQRRGISNTGQLTAMRSDDLKELAKQFGVPQTGKKAEVINSIAATAGMGTMRNPEQVISDVDALIRLAATDPATARRNASSLDPNELLQVPLPKMRQLATALQLRREFAQRQGAARGGAPSRELIIQTLTGTRTERSLSRENREQIISNKNTCLSADPEVVRRIAESLRIPTLGLTHAQVCDRIFAAHLSRVSELILKRGGDIQEIAQLPQQEQSARVKALARTLRLNNVNTLGDLIAEWMLAHYQARTGTLFPDRQKDVMDFIMYGNLPEDSGAVRDIGVIFSDVRRDMYNMQDQQRREALQGLFNQFIRRIDRGEQAGINAFLANLGRFGFGTFQQGSPNRLGNTSPRGEASTTISTVPRGENTLMGITSVGNPRGPTTLSHPNISTETNIRYGNGVRNANLNATGDFNIVTGDYDDLRGFATKVYSRDADPGGENSALDTNAGGQSARRGDYVNPNVDSQGASINNAFIPDSIGEGTQPGHYSVNNGSRPDVLAPGSNRNGTFNNLGTNGRVGNPLNAIGGEFGAGLPTTLSQSFGNGFNGGNGSGLNGNQFGSDYDL